MKFVAFAVFPIFFLCLTHDSVVAESREAQCAYWAVRRIYGTGSSGPKVNVSDPSIDEVFGNSGQSGAKGPGRPGKHGPKGEQGPKGQRGPPGVCDCVAPEVEEMRRETEVLKDKLERIRASDPSRYCLLGMKSGHIPDSAITASSQYPGFETRHGRLDQKSWRPNPYAPNPGKQWIMVDFGQVMVVSGIVSQGNSAGSYWVKTFKVEYSSHNGTKFFDITNENGSEKVFQGNTDATTMVVNRFPHRVHARFVRIYPLTAQGNIVSFRFDLIDC